MSVPNLNLINFEHPSSKCSKYILTSPKSLKACQKAGVKPVELLYRSLADVRRDVGKKEAHTTYEMLEKERQEKLEKCRKIRNELLMQGYPRCTPSSSLREHHSNRSPPRMLPPATVNTFSASLPPGNTFSTPLLPPGDTVSAPLPPGNTFSMPAPLHDHSRSSIKSGAGSPDSNRIRNENSRDVSSPFPVVTKIDTSPAVVEVTKKPVEAYQSPLPSLTTTASNSPDEGTARQTDEVTTKTKATPKTRRKHARSQSLPSRPGTPNTKPVKPFSRNASSLDNYDRKFPVDINGQPKRSNSRNSVSLASIYTPVIDRKADHHVSFEDINNNHFKAPIIMRPNSSHKMRQIERRKLMECKKVFDKIQAQYKDPEYCLLKYRQIIENSIERELREQEVRKVQRRIEEGVEMWQDRVLMLQWLDNERAEEQITKNLATKIERMKQKQRNKEIIHSINMNKVKEEDDIKAEILRRELEKKERKIQVLQEEKERVICESKSRAQAVSELKEQIRNIMTPETFDRKVSKCGRESKVHRVLHPPARCPTIMQQSHISLG